MLARNPIPIPDDVTRLFWDVDPALVYVESHKDYVMGRVMTRGGWDAMRWLRMTYSTPVLRDFLARKGGLLAPRELAYWALVLDMDIEAERGAGTPVWAAP